MKLTVPALEVGVLRLFALSMDAEQARALARGGAPALEEALGTAPLDPDHVEVFALSDLGDMALTDYLVEGPGIERAQLEPDRIKLSSLDGWVMLVYSGAFGGEQRELVPHADLTLIGTYSRPGADWSAPVDLSTPSALPTPRAAPVKRPSDAAMSGRIAVAALLVAFFVVGLMIWVGS